MKQMTMALSMAMAEIERDEMMMKMAWSGDWRWHRRGVSPQCHLWYTTSTLENRSYLYKARQYSIPNNDHATCQTKLAVALTGL